MLTFQEARAIAEDKLKSWSMIDDTAIIDNATIEKPYAWILHPNGLFNK